MINSSKLRQMSGFAGGNRNGSSFVAHYDMQRSFMCLGRGLAAKGRVTIFSPARAKARLIRYFALDTTARGWPTGVCGSSDPAWRCMANHGRAGEPAGNGRSRESQLGRDRKARHFPILFSTPPVGSARFALRITTRRLAYEGTIRKQYEHRKSSRIAIGAECITTNKQSRLRPHLNQTPHEAGWESGLPIVAF